MSHLLEETIDQLQTSESVDDIPVLLKTLRENYDLDHIVYHSGGPGLKEQNLFTYPVEWVMHYINEGYRNHDPVYMSTQRSWLPVEWSRLNWSGKMEHRILKEALDGGVGLNGYSIPMRGAAGRFAMLSFNVNAKPAQWESQLEAQKRDYLLLSHYVHEKVQALTGEEEATIKELSPRERDVLTLLSLGKSRAQAAEQLKISEHTFRVYVDTARHKLGALNTTHAVAVALIQRAIVI